MSAYQIPELPDFTFTASDRCTYVRISVKPPEGGGRKRALKTVGRIDSDTGCGPITFTEEFLDEYPSLRCFEVSREEDWTAFTGLADEDLLGYYPLIFTPKEYVRPIKPDLSCLSIGYALWCRKVLREDKMLDALKKRFPDTHRSFLAAACFKAARLTTCDAGLDSYAAMAALPFDENLTQSKLSSLKAALDDESINRFFEQLRLTHSPRIIGSPELYIVPPLPGFPYTLAMWYYIDRPLCFELFDADELHGSAVAAALDHAPRMCDYLPSLVISRRALQVERLDLLEPRLGGINILCDERRSDICLTEDLTRPLDLDYKMAWDLKAIVDPFEVLRFDARYKWIPYWGFDVYVMPYRGGSYFLLSTYRPYAAFRSFDVFLKLHKLYAQLNVTPSTFYDKHKLSAKLKADLFELMLTLHVRDLLNRSYAEHNPYVSYMPDKRRYSSIEELLKHLHGIKALYNRENGRKFILPMSDEAREAAHEFGLPLSDSCTCLEDLFY